MGCRDGAGGGGKLTLLSAGAGSGLRDLSHRPSASPQAVAGLEKKHSTELEQLCSSLEAKHREVRRGWPGPMGQSLSSQALSCWHKSSALPLAHRERASSPPPAPYPGWVGWVPNPYTQF